MNRRTFLSMGTAALSLQAGCLRVSERDPQTTADTDDAIAGTTTPTESTGLNQQWRLERDVRLFNDLASTATDGNVLTYTNSSPFADNHGFIVALDVDDGSKAWEHPKPSAVIVDLKFSDGELYLLSSDGRLTVLDAADGTKIWDRENPFQSEAADDPFWVGNLSIGSERIVISVSDINSDRDFSYLYGVSKESQAVEWKLDPETITSYAETDIVRPAGISTIDNGTVFVGFSRYTMSVEVANGDVNWTQSSARATGPITVTESAVFVPANSVFYSLERTNGKVRWEVNRDGPTAGNFATRPLAEGETVFVPAGDTTVYAFDRETGTSKWTGATGGPIRVAPIVTESVVWAGSRDGRIYGFDRSTGETLTSELIGKPIVGFEAADDVLLALTETEIVGMTAE